MLQFWAVVDQINNVIWHPWVLFVVLATGVVFTLWTRLGQWRALTHGVQVIRGRYDRSEDPGAINHFQALSTALSATVGLGNIAGVALAISLGGPGAVFWMWVVGAVGMCLKMTEVTQAMLFRDTSDPGNPHGGAMWVCRKGFARLHPALASFGTILGGIFCLTLIVSCVTGGNMFQAWNVADITLQYFGVPRLVTGAILTLGVGVVVLGGIRRIGDVAGRIVPFMCGLYLLAGLYVIIVNIAEVPALLEAIFRGAFSRAEGSGAFLGGAAGYAFLKGMQRALFSNEAGQGSAPIAHSAARTDEPVREGIVAGLEPFVDTLLVCTITALVILLSGTWNREPGLVFPHDPPAVARIVDGEAMDSWALSPTVVAPRDGSGTGHAAVEGLPVFAVARVGANPETGGELVRVEGTLRSDAGSGALFAEFEPVSSPTAPELVGSGLYFDYNGATLTARAYDRVLPGLGRWVVPAVVWLFAFSTMISWCYYGEQGVQYLLGGRAIFAFRLVYCALILVTVQIVRTQDQLDVLSSLGTGVMLWVNIPIMLVFGPMAMRAYRDYVRRLDAGSMEPGGQGRPH